MSSDASDLADAQAGDQDAFARLYDGHAGVVLSLCRCCTHPAEAEDAMQETFVRAYRRLNQLARGDRFRPWLYAIARRVCAEQQRARARRSRREAQAVMERTRSLPQVETSFRVIAQAEELDRLTMAMDALSDNERLAIHLYYLDPDPLDAARCALGLSRSGFYKLLGRARKRLAASMQETQMR